MIGNYHSITSKEQINKSSHIQGSTETLAKNGTFTSESGFPSCFRLIFSLHMNQEHVCKILHSKELSETYLALNVYNCSENNESMKQLIKRLNLK